jgi:hypothetical protein
MSVKQISFSPELLDTPELKEVNFDESVCHSKTDTDLSNFEFSSLDTIQKFNFDANLPVQSGGDATKEKQEIEETENPSENNNEDPNEDNNEDNNQEIENVDLTQDDDDNDLTPINFGEQSGGVSLDLANLDSDVTMDEVTNNQDNPGEDPQQADDIIDENDREYEEDGTSIKERLNEIMEIHKEMSTPENQNLIQDLENKRLDNVTIDLNLLTQKLERELDLYWDKNLDIAFIEKKVDEYIKNHESKEYETYRKMLMYILSKTKAGYKVTINNKSEYVMHKGDESKYDVKLIPPKYIDLKTENTKLQREITNTKFSLYQHKLDILENADIIMEEDLKEFRKLQKKYYDLKHKEVIYDKYHKKINNRPDNEIDMFLNFIKKKSNFKTDVAQTIETKYIKAPLEFQESIKQSKISSLQLFNEIKNKFEMKSKSNEKFTKEEKKEMKNLIKKYLTTGNTLTVLNMIGQFQNKYKKQINIIIEKKPVIDVVKGKKKM